MGFFGKIKKGLGKAGRGIGRGIKKGARGIGKGIKKGARGIGKGIKGAVKIGGKLGKGIAKGVKKGVMFGVKIVGNVALLPLVAFIPAMKKAIKKKGKRPKKSLLGIVNQFRKVVLAKQHYDCYDGTYFSYDDYQKNYLDPMSVTMLVKLVMGYFNSLKAKAAAGEEMTEQEEEMIELVEKGEAAVIAGATEEIEGGIGKFVNENKVAIGITVVALFGTIIALVARSGGKKG